MKGRWTFLVIPLTVWLVSASDARPSSILAAGIEKRILVAADSVAWKGTDHGWLTTTNSDSSKKAPYVPVDPIRKLTAFGKGGVLAHYGSDRVPNSEENPANWARVANIIDVFLGQAKWDEHLGLDLCHVPTPQEEKEASRTPTWDPKDPTGGQHLKENLDRLARRIRDCWSRPEVPDISVRLVLFFFDDRSSTPLVYRIDLDPKYEEGNWAVVISEPLSKEMIPADCACDAPHKVGFWTFGDTSVLDRTIFGVDKLFNRADFCNPDKPEKQRPCPLHELELDMIHLDQFDRCLILLVKQLCEFQVSAMDIPLRSRLEKRLGALKTPVERENYETTGARMTMMLVRPGTRAEEIKVSDIRDSDCNRPGNR